MWSLKRDGEGSENEKSYYLVVGEHLVGRKDCQIQVTGDQSVSRKHAWITVSQTGAATSQVTLKDVSKFGCSLNGVKCKHSVAFILKHEDKITFGTQDSSYRLKYEPFVLFTSCLDNAKKKNLKSQLSKLGGYMVNEWQKECSHLVMEALSFTVKVIYALVTCCPIVMPSYFDDLVEAIESTKAELPLPEKYMPPIKEDLIDPQVVSFQPNEARKCVFAGKLFLFLEKKQHKRLAQAIALAGGKYLLKENGDASGSDDDMLTDKDTLVMSVDLKSGVSETREMWVGHVGDVLKSVNRRPIAETEVGLAILHMSLKEYCNSSVNHVPQITKQIVSKSISTMEEMSQRMNESQIVTTVITPQETKKRSRNGSEEAKPLTFETPLSRNLESKRRKLSPSDVTHILQTPLSEIKTPGVLQGSPAAQRPQVASPTDRQSRETPKENSSISKTDITHISQSENYQIEDHSISESPVIGLKRKSTAPNIDITHISQSQESEKDKKPRMTNPGGKKQLRITCSSADVIPKSQESQNDEKPSPCGKKLRLTRSKADVTHISQSQFPQDEEKPNRERNPRDITHISQSQDLQSTAKRSDAVSTSNQRHKPSISEEKEINFIPESQTSLIEAEVKETPSPVIPFISKRRKTSSPTEVKVEETPSPEISFISKRRKISSPKSDVTHISDTERSMVAEPQESLHGPNSPTAKQTTLDDSTSTPGSLTGFSNKETNSRKLNSKGDVLETTDDKETSKPSVNDELLSVKKSASCLDTSKDAAHHIDKVVPENTTRVQDLTATKTGVGWMSKKSSCVKKEKSETIQNDNMDNRDGGQGIEDLNGTSERKVLENGNTQKASQGFLSKQEQQRLPEQSEVKREDTEFPSDLICVEHIELVVAKRAHPPKTQQSEKTFSTTLKNMKKFRKQNYVGDEQGLPRIIGGSDLVVFSSRTAQAEDWMLEVQAMSRQDLEDRDADDLFRYEPKDTKRRGRR